MALALPPINHGVKVTYVGDNNGAPWMNTMHYTYTGADVTQAQLFTFNTALQTAWGANLASVVNTAAHLTKINTIDLTSDHAATAYSTFSPIAGTRAPTGTSVLPTSACCVVSENVQLRYRGGHPRIYAPFGIASDVSTGRFWTTTAQTAFQTAVNSWFSAIGSVTSGSNTYTLQLISYYSGSVKGSEPGGRLPVLRPAPLPFPITGLSIHGRMDTQRRRLGKEST